MAKYATITEIRNYTRVGAAELGDAALTDMIDSATARIDRETGRTWQGVQTATNELYTGDGSSRLILKNSDIGTISAISVNSSSTGSTYTTLTVSSVRVQSDIGVIEFQPDAEVPYAPEYRTSVKITYTWGNATPVDDIKLACRYLVAYIMKIDSEINTDYYNIINCYKRQIYRIV